VSALTRQRALIGMLFACVGGVLGFAGTASARWSVQPTPSLQKHDVFTGVSCTSSKACVAVGNPGDGAKAGPLFAERWNGRVWSVQRLPTPAPARRDFLAGVSCSTRTACVAVGSTKTNLLVEAWNGKRWSIEHLPTPSRSRFGGDLRGVACYSKTGCVAVGDWAGKVGFDPLVERWNGSTWSIQPTPEPYGTTDVKLYGVACTSQSACTAVGTGLDNNNFEVGVAERWNGHRWSVQYPHSLPLGSSEGVDTYLTGVSCASSTACVAIGYGDRGSSGSGDLLYQLGDVWNGKAWGPVHQAFAGTEDGDWVSCASSGACLAVGDAIERWNGSSWSDEAGLPGYKNSLYPPTFQGVSCTSRTSCEAVGIAYNENNGNEFPLAARWTS
jgi:hypothetical protein